MFRSEQFAGLCPVAKVEEHGNRWSAHSSHTEVASRGPDLTGFGEELRFDHRAGNSGPGRCRPIDVLCALRRQRWTAHLGYSWVAQHAERRAARRTIIGKAPWGSSLASARLCLSMRMNTGRFTTLFYTHRLGHCFDSVYRKYWMRSYGENVEPKSRSSRKRIRRSRSISSCTISRQLSCQFWRGG